MTSQELLTAYLNADELNIEEREAALTKRIMETVHIAVKKRDDSYQPEWESDCLFSVWTRIAAMKAGRDVSPIENLDAFINTVVKSKFCDSIRRKRPAWYNKKVEITEIFSGKTGYTGVTILERRYCALKGMTGDRRVAGSNCKELAKESDSVRAFKAARLGNKEPFEFGVGDLCIAVLEHCGGPVDIDVLTGTVVDLLQLKNLDPVSIDKPVSEDDDSLTIGDSLVSEERSVEDQVCEGDYFDNVARWLVPELMALTRERRMTVLLALDREQIMSLISSVGIDAVTELFETDKNGLYDIVRRIPLSDAEIGRETGVEVRAIPSMRFKAWERIRRHVKKTNFDI